MNTSILMRRTRHLAVRYGVGILAVVCVVCLAVDIKHITKAQVSSPSGISPSASPKPSDQPDTVKSQVEEFVQEVDRTLGSYSHTPANRLVDTCGESKWFTFCGA
jgi:hypothetical protein